MTVGHRSGLTDCYNRTRRRLRARWSRNSTDDAQAEAEAAVMAATASQWGGSSGPYLQQVMPGWHAGLSWRQLVCCLFAVALITGALTYVGLTSWLGVTEFEVEYTDCSVGEGGVCRLTLKINSSMNGPVYLYYALRNAYFNHRRIQTAWSLRQMLGLQVDNQSLMAACREHAYRDGSPVMPCGAFPNAIFNDTIKMLGPQKESDKGSTSGNSSAAEVPLSKYQGIGWLSNTRGMYKPLTAEQLSGTVRPISWPQSASVRYSRPFADAEDLKAWLQTPAFSHFRIMSHRVMLPDGLAKGTYQLLIGNYYPVSEFGGTKRFIFAEKSQLGGKNLTLALLPAVTCVCYILLCISVLINCYCRSRAKTN